MDPGVHRVLYSAGQTATNSRLLYGRLRQAKRRGENPAALPSSVTLPAGPRDINLGLFALSQEAEKQKEETERQQEDEEGWVKVTRGPKGTKARPHSEAANKKALQKEIRKKKRKELLNFYTWQHRNTQKERKLLLKFLFSICRLDCMMFSEGDREAVMINCILSLFLSPDIAELRKKFEEDKQRIALLRAQRKFKPY